MCLCASLPSKVLALVSCRAGESTVRNTVLRVEEVMGRLGADLAAPVGTLKEVWYCRLQLDIFLLDLVSYLCSLRE